MNSVFDCHLSPVGRQMAIENSVSIDFLSTFVDSINVFDCRQSDVYMYKLNKIIPETKGLYFVIICIMTLSFCEHDF